jgi:subtilisin family serine protease
VRRALILSAIPFLISAALDVGPGWGQPVTAPDRELSRQFLPPRYRVPDPQAKARVKTWFLRESGDSTQVSFKGNVLRLNGDANRRLQNDSSTGSAPIFPGESSRQRARRKLEQLAGAGVEEDPVYAAAEYIPDDLALQTTPQWPLRNDGSLVSAVPGLDIGMSKVWEKLDGDDSLVIAVLDAGINFYHPDLQGRWFVNTREANGLPGIDDDANGFIDDSTGWDFVDDDNRPLDSHGHGTFLSGVIAARVDNALGIAGMLPRARILPVRVLSTTGSGSSSDIAAGIRYAVKMGVRVLNFSIGINSTAADTVLQNAFKIARDSGMIVAAASANDARNLDDPLQARAPSNYGYANVYMVASHHQAGGLSAFSNYGATRVDLAAPGENIVTTTIPAAVQFARETFEDTVRQWKFSKNFAVGSDTLEGLKSLRCQPATRANDTAVWDSLDLRGRSGTALTFMLDFKPAGSGQNIDWLYVQMQPVGAAANAWTDIGIVTSAVTGKTTLAFDCGTANGKLIRIRFRTDVVVTGSRLLRIDDVRIKYADEDPAHQANYTNTGGTSLAAPYVAGYAALMRLACARTGVPLTRERMLAGATPDSFLVGKVSTGGRLDVAKGLDFYLRTLPRLAIAESDTLWPANNAVRYTLSVRDTSNQAVSGYTFASGPGTAGGSLTGSQFAWSQGSRTGSFTARFRAEKSPLVLRTQVRFTLTTAVRLGSAEITGPSTLRIGSRVFLLPASALQGRTQTLRLEFYGADGRTVRSVSGDLWIPAGAQRAEYRLNGFPGIGLRAWIDGVPLQPAR